jgi:hypothetical protein
VVKCLRDFVHERQSKFDPLGRRVFKVAEKAVRETLRDGEIFIVSGGGDIGNRTVLAFAASACPNRAEAARELLAETVPEWNDVLLPDLVTAAGSRARDVVETLRQQLLALRALGVLAFRFRDVIRPLKNDVRRRWTAGYDTESGDDDTDKVVVLRQLRPEQTFEDVQSFHRLADCVVEKIEARRHNPHRQQQLSRLFTFLRLWAVDPESPQRPSNRWLADRLGISRGTMPELFKILGKMVKGCLGVPASPPGNGPGGGGRSGGARDG